MTRGRLGACAIFCPIVLSAGCAEIANPESWSGGGGASVSSGSGSAGSAASGGSGASSGCAQATTTTLRDGFEITGSYNTSLWDEDEQGEATATQSGGSLVIALPDFLSPAAATYMTDGTFDLRRCALTLDVPEVPSTDGPYVFMAVRDEALTEGFAIAASQNLLVLQHSEGALGSGREMITNVGEMPTYSSPDHARWRLRIDDEAIWAEAAPASGAWVTITSTLGLLDLPAWVGDARVQIGAGTGAEVAAVQARFESFEARDP